jgi:hypothetical protein
MSGQSRDILLELHPEYGTWECDVSYFPGTCAQWSMHWHTRPVIATGTYTNYLSFNNYMPNNSMRGWSWHYDFWTGYQGTTSDGY